MVSATAPATQIIGVAQSPSRQAAVVRAMRPPTSDSTPASSASPHSTGRRRVSRSLTSSSRTVAKRACIADSAAAT